MKNLAAALVAAIIWSLAGAGVIALAQQVQPASNMVSLQEVQLAQNLIDGKKAVDAVVRGFWNDINVMFNNQQAELNKERDAVAWWAGCVKDQVCVEWVKGAPK